MLPGWLELIRAIGTLSIWLLTPLMIWFTVWSVRQHQKWEAGKLERLERWKAGMDEVARMREEAVRLRAQAEVTLAHAEVALAQARRPLLPQEGGIK
jgi:hypothetical protein